MVKSIAPNETEQQYDRKLELMNKGLDSLTPLELDELRQLAQIATSHLMIKGV